MSEPDFQPENLGYVNLSRHHDFWVNKLNTKNFIHSSGFITKFKTKGIKADYYKYDFSYRIVEDPCWTASGYDYYSIYYETIEYKSDDIPIVFNYKRDKYTGPDLDSISLVNATERLFVEFNNSSFEIPIDSSRNRDFFNFYDSLYINNYWYYNVYHRYLDTNNIGNDLKVIGVYYNFEFGLVDFYLNNGERWSIEQ